jgi:hypothetical protein
MKPSRKFDVYKNLAIFAGLVAAIYVTFIVFNTCTRNSIEGLAANTTTTTPTVADADPDLKCPAFDSGDPTKCTVVDLMKLAYGVASDPRMSVMEIDNISGVCGTRKFKAIDRIGRELLMLRAATMYNTTANEKLFKSILDGMTKNKNECYDNNYMNALKAMTSTAASAPHGISATTVGTKEKPTTLTIAQSETMRCYAHRLNAFKKCLNACK